MLESKIAHGSYKGLKLQGAYSPSGLRENVYLAPILGRETKGLLTVREGPPKVLEAYMGEVMWPNYKPKCVPTIIS